MDELREMLEKEMKLRKNLTILLGVLMAVLIIGGGMFLMCLMELQGSLKSMLEVLNELDIDSLNASIKGLSEVLNKLDVNALNGSLQETQKALAELNEATQKVSNLTSIFK